MDEGELECLIEFIGEALDVKWICGSKKLYVW